MQFSTTFIIVFLGLSAAAPIIDTFVVNTNLTTLSPHINWAKSELGQSVNLDIPDTEWLTRCSNVRWVEKAYRGNPYLWAECRNLDGSMEVTRKLQMNYCFANDHGVLNPRLKGAGFGTCYDCQFLIPDKGYGYDDDGEKQQLLGIVMKCRCIKDNRDVTSNKVALLGSSIITTNDDGQIGCFGVYPS